MKEWEGLSIMKKNLYYKTNESVDEIKTRKKREKGETLDSSVVSRFIPLSSNVVCYGEKDDKFDLCLVAMRRGEVKWIKLEFVSSVSILLNNIAFIL